MFKPGQLSPMQKAVAVNTMMGNPSIANQQGTTRVMYDTLPLDGRQEFRFFENVANRQFPFTNLNQNRLQVGETFVLKRIYFAIITQNAAPVSVTVSDVSGSVPELLSADFSIYFDTMQVVKPIPLASTMPQFSIAAKNDNSNILEFDNLLTLPTDIQFRCEVDTNAYNGPLDNVYFRCTWEGFGTILSPKSQF